MITVPPPQARAILLHAAGFDRDWPTGDAGIYSVLDALQWIQLDPIDRVGQNADLVVGARVEGVVRGDVHRCARGRSFEHFAKERCIIHARHFAHYRHQAVATPWWRNTERMEKVPAGLVEQVLEEVRDRGPMAAEDLTARGRVEAIDWAGWKGTSRVEVLALEVLWARCDVVVSGRDERGRRIYDVPARMLPDESVAPKPAEPFGETMVEARVRSAGLLSRAGGAQWSMLAEARTDGTVDRLLAAGRVVEVRVGRRPYLTLPESLALDVDGVLAATQGRSAVLGPLDPLIWDRALVAEAFDFEYLWEIYKPAAQRRWGYYVCPVLVDGTLTSRVEARRQGTLLVVEKCWGEAEPGGWTRAIARLAALNGCDHVEASSCDFALKHCAARPIRAPE